MRAAADAYRSVEPNVRLEWAIRPGHSFAYDALDGVAAEYDLVSYDHPHVGAVARTGALCPLDGLLSAAVLEALAGDSIGESHNSYKWQGKQWGLATDAAAQVSVVRPDLLSERARPRTWDDVMELAHEAQGRVTTSLVEADAICSVLTFCANHGTPITPTAERFADPEVVLPAIEWFARYARYCHPTAFDGYIVGPMAAGEDIVFGLLQWGYTDMARPSFEGRHLMFVDIPSAGSGPVGSTLGGAGLGVSSSSHHQAEAAAFAAWVTGAGPQCSVVARHGGQPGSATAWNDDALDREVGGFFSGTLATIEGAQVRPREAWFPEFQRTGGQVLRTGLKEGHDAAAILDGLEHSYREALNRFLRDATQ